MFPGGSFRLVCVLMSLISLIVAEEEKKPGGDCETPAIHDGRLRLVDSWPNGFAVMVELQLASTDLPTSGWSAVIVFDEPVGKKSSVTSWGMKLSAISDNGGTLTLTNVKHNRDLSKSTEFSILLVINNIKGVQPQRAYVGFYGHQVEDASCATPTHMTIFDGADGHEAPDPETTSSTKPLSPNGSKKPLTTTKAISHTTTTTTTTVSPTTKVMSPSTTLLSPGATYCVIQKQEGYYNADDNWVDGGNYYFSGNIILSAPQRLDDWWMVAVFEDQIAKIQTWAIRIIDHTENGLVWTFGPHPWSKSLEVGETDVRFIATQGYATTASPNAQVYICSKSFSSGDAVMTRPISDDGMPETEAEETSVATDSPLQTLRPMTSPETEPTTVPREHRCLPGSRRGSPVVRAGQTKLNFAPNIDGTKYNLNELLHKSILFYEAQRSGYLPATNRIPWRGDSGLKDGCDIGVDVTGGWYDAGDAVKFNFPMAFSLTMLAWGGIAFREAYEDAGELENMIDLIKWPTEYFIKTHISKYELVGQVGHGQTDHDYWGRHEEMKMRRPTYTITAKKPGTELAAEVAAALAASSIFLRQTDPELSDSALKHAKEIFEFADKYRGNYHKAIPDVAKYYKSYSGYRDELVWSATWLYKATNDTFYLKKAIEFYNKMNGKYTVAKEFSWDHKLAGAQVLLAEITGKDDFRRPFERFLGKCQSLRTTPQGMYYFIEWGSNRYAANVAFLAIVGARLQPALPKRAKHLSWARKQIGLLLGEAGRSYVVGFGENPPKRAHHASSSCPPYPQRCDWSLYHSPKANHYILYGALVGGPNLKGVYGDNRALYQETEVACDYNAGFQSAIAGLKQFALERRAAKSAVATATATTTVTEATGPETTQSTTTKATEPSTTVSKQSFTTKSSTSKPKSPSTTATKKPNRPRVRKPKARKGPCKTAKSPRCLKAALAKKRRQSS